jgi:adenylate cyclase
MGESDRGEVLRDRVGHRTWSRIAVANVTGALLAAASGALTGANIKGQPDFGVVDTITLGVYLAVAFPLGRVWGERRYKAATAWLAEGRQPTAPDQRATLLLPLEMAALALTGWLGAVVLWTLLTAVSHPAAYVVRVAVSILLGGLTTTALSYLLIEWAQRPLVALVLAARVPGRRVAPGVRTRLIASWAIGADVFLLMIGLTFLGRPASEPPSAGAIWFIVAAGLAAGTLVVHVASRSLANPLRDLRTAVDRVEQGQLDVAVAVDDGGEVGLLQAGFNRMVVGLRERDALRDLFGRHVGEEVARQAVQRGVELGGERTEVGVLFVDLIGSTQMAQRTSPDQVVALLNQFFGTIVRVVAAEGGWVNKFEGDGALCVFGTPIPLDDYAVRALRAARTIRRELLALGALHPELDAAIGVSAGSVVAGNVGAEQRFEYTVIGTPVNEAARLTDLAKHRMSRVLAGEDAIARAEIEAGSWLVVDEVQLRGWSEPILVYEPAAAARVTEVADHAG